MLLAFVDVADIAVTALVASSESSDFLNLTRSGRAPVLPGSTSLESSPGRAEWRAHSNNHVAELEEWLDSLLASTATVAVELHLPVMPPFRHGLPAHHKLDRLVLESV